MGITEFEYDDDERVIITWKEVRLFLDFYLISYLNQGNFLIIKLSKHWFFFDTYDFYFIMNIIVNYFLNFDKDSELTLLKYHGKYTICKNSDDQYKCVVFGTKFSQWVIYCIQSQIQNIQTFFTEKNPAA